MSITVTPSQATRHLRTAIQARRPVFLWGAPGIGKSEIVAQTADDLYAPDYNNERDPHDGNRPWLVDMRLALRDPVDLRGLPVLDRADGLTHWAQPAELPRCGTGILFIDEMNRAAVSIQNAAFQLILDRRLGDYILPEGWVLVAAGNRESDGGGVTRMPSALSNRFIHLEIEPDLQDWCLWALGAGIHPLLIALMRWRPELLHQFDRNARAFPSPRTWAYASDLLRQQPARDDLLALLAGTVGEGAAVETVSYIDLFETLPSVDAILLSPQTAPVPGSNRTGELYAISSALAHRATADNLERVLQYTERLPQEYNVFCVRDIVVRAPQLQSTPAFISWAINHQGVI